MRGNRTSEPAAAGVVDFYVRTHSRHALILRTSVAIRAMRAVLPLCPLEDRDLAVLIEDAAVRHRAAAIFDLPRIRSGAVTPPAPLERLPA